MPLLGGTVKCYQCYKEESFMWHQTPKGVQCNDCHEVEHTFKVLEEEEQKQAALLAEKPKAPAKKGNKTARSYKTRQNPNALPKLKQYSTKGKGRRIIFKKKEPTKLTASCATYTTSKSVYYKGSVWRSGDIVSVRDVDGGIYYAQLGSFLIDMYSEKSASLTWLLPIRDNLPYERDGFDLMRFVRGPHDDMPHKLEYFEFVMHCPPTNPLYESYPIGSSLVNHRVFGHVPDRQPVEDKAQKK